MAVSAFAGLPLIFFKMRTETEIKLDRIVEAFVEKCHHRNGYDVYEIPYPLKISILGHSGAGKTTLIESMVKYLTDEFDSDDRLSVFVPSVSQRKYSRIHLVIDSLCKNDVGFISNLNLGRGTSSVQSFDFFIEFKISQNLKLSLPVMIQDTPGGFHSFVNLDTEKYPDCSPEYLSFVNHLKESQIVIIPIDAVKMQSVDMNDSDLLGAYSDTIQLKSIKSNLQQYFAKKSDRKYSLHFVLTKCETYFSQDETGLLQEKCFDNFKYWYSDVVNLFYNYKNLDIHYTPVETVGSFKLKETNCIIVENELGKQLQNKSLFEATGQKKRIINGINDLTDDIFSMIDDLIKNGYISDIRRVNEKFIKYDKGFINFFTGRNADSNKIKNLLFVIDLARPELEQAWRRMVQKNRNDGYEYHKLIRQKL